MKFFMFFISLFSVFVSALSCQNAQTLPEGLYARMITAKGEIVLKLEFEKTPLTVANFIGLAEGTLDASKGKKFYDGLTFHRVIKDFMIQGGDPRGNGEGGPGYEFPNEIDQTLTHSGPGILSMANSGPGTNGSQFFITHKETPWLDGRHTVFGRLVTGQEVVNIIQQGDTIKSVTIIRSGAKAKKFKSDQEAFNRYRAVVDEKIRINRSAAREKTTQTVKTMYPGITTSNSGILSVVTRAGTGAKPKIGQTVSVLYSGMFLDKQVFDASSLHGNKPIEFSVGDPKLIMGWSFAIQEMRTGEKRTVILPPELAYGEAGAGNGFIPPDSWLIFELELVAVK